MKLVFKILLLNLLYSSITKAQTFDTKYFRGTMWASISKDSLTFKADTIKFVKIIEDTYLKNAKAMDIAGYFKGADFITFKFMPNGKLKMETHNVENGTVSNIVGKYRWDFNNKQKAINLYFNNKLFTSLIPLFATKVKIGAKYMYNPSFITKEIILKKN